MRNGGVTDGMVLAPKNGNGQTKLARKMKSSVCLGNKKNLVGAKSRSGKGMVKKMGWSDSSQPGIRQFLMEIRENKNLSSNGNSLGSSSVL